MQLEPATLDALDLSIRPLGGQMTVFGSTAMHLGPMDNHLGMIARMRGDLAAAVERHRLAVELAEAAGQRLWVGWSQTHLAEALMAVDERDVEIARLVDSALRHARWTGSRRLATAAQTVGDAAGGR